MEIKDRTIALLIDSDNVSAKYFSIILDELSQYGKVTYRRLYGDFTNPKANGWKQALLDYSIEQIQQVAFTTGKNATDSKMIIDAMDILYKGNVDCFCLATSDSDFTNLAMRFRNDNLVVIGAGEQKTPSSFIIHHMLKNRRYLGEYRFRDIVHPNAFPAIILEELFERVQQKIKKRRHDTKPKMITY
ncbi:MAG: NYN domain-containing protein [Clostridia bacterium]|nr:NYN domain-containing protein [Clostridia bacterium]